MLVFNNLYSWSLMIFYMILKCKKNRLLCIASIILLVLILTGSYSFLRNPYKFRGDGPIKILWVDSYHPEMEWASEQIKGFKALLDFENVDYELKVFHMDTKRKPKEEFDEIGMQVASLIDEWDPDLVYATDDNAQKYVGMKYVDSDLPWVFSGVNAEPEDYDYDAAKNIAGVLERELFVDGIELLQTINPSLNNLGVIVDDSETGALIMENFKSSLNIAGTEVVEWSVVNDFDNYKKKIFEYNEKADALVLLPIYTAKDKNGEVVAMEDVVEWTVKNSNIPEISSSTIHVKYGALLAVEATGYKTGYEAGQIALQILLEGIKPFKIGSYVVKGDETQINYARAKQLGLKIPGDILLSASICESFPWENENCLSNGD
jgi:ABC-type uncharacterized transport system substrate-binding protein